jgi:hypothetical protein
MRNKISPISPLMVMQNSAAVPVRTTTFRNPPALEPDKATTSISKAIK